MIDTLRNDRHFSTFQDFEKAGNDKAAFVLGAIKEYRASFSYRTAMDADLYDRQLNKTINDYVQIIYDMTGSKLVDFTASNKKIASNFFHRLNTQRCMYSLGAGLSFTNDEESGSDSTKEKLGKYFDHDIRTAAYYALIHGVSYCFWNLDRLYVFPMTEFCPFWDEKEGTLRAGARFWRLDRWHPMTVVLYEEDGYTRFETDSEADLSLHMVEDKKAYIQDVHYVEANGEEAVVGEENYSALPIVPMWGSRMKQSTLVGMQSAIDSYDLIRSGFANDLSDVAQIYWAISNAAGMDDSDIQRFLDRVKLMHVAVVDSDEGQSVEPVTMEPPYQARKQYLDDIRAQIYEDFGALDVHTVAAGSTNDHIDAAYQPMDEEASDFEYQIGEAIQQILKLQDIDDSPVFKRSRISNQAEQVSMIVQESQWLDQETILRKLPNITPKEVQGILTRLEEEENERMSNNLMGAAAVSAGVASPEEAGVNPDNVFNPEDEDDEEESSEDDA